LVYASVIVRGNTHGGKNCAKRPGGGLLSLAARIFELNLDAATPGEPG
jgi:hypothetical protein